MNLAEMKVGEQATLSCDESIIPTKLLELGFYNGNVVTLVRKTPLGDPLIYAVDNDDQIAIRKELACQLTVEPTV